MDKRDSQVWEQGARDVASAMIAALRKKGIATRGVENIRPMLIEAFYAGAVAVAGWGDGQETAEERRERAHDELWDARQAARVERAARETRAEEELFRVPPAIWAEDLGEER